MDESTHFLDMQHANKATLDTDADDLARYAQNAREAEEYERNLNLSDNGESDESESDEPQFDLLDDSGSTDLLADTAPFESSEPIAVAAKPKKARKPRAKKETVIDDLLGDSEADRPAKPPKEVVPWTPPAAPIPKRNAYDHLLEVGNTPCLDQEHGKNWSMFRGDCVEVIRGIPDESIHFSVFSPPFASLFCYSNSERDMGNCKSADEFQQHFEFLIRDIHRTTKSGRLCSVHCMNLPTTIAHHGVIGLQDFRGDIIRSFQSAGWIYHSEVAIWKDPVIAMQRTKAIGLLHKQLVKDSCMSRQGIPDYVCTFRKPGKNEEPVEGELDRWIGEEGSFKSEGRLSIDIWQRFASPIWMDIDPGKTLQYMSAREDNDERHICPLQLEVIDRCTELWSNPGDVVLSPFAGIGSEGFVAVKGGRKFIGIELKETYFKMAGRNLTVAANTAREKKLF